MSGQPQVIPFEQAFKIEAGENGFLSFGEIIETTRIRDGNMSYGVGALADIVLNVLTGVVEETVEVIQLLHIEGVGTIEEKREGKILSLEYPGVFSVGMAKHSGLRIEKGKAVVILRGSAVLTGTGLVTGGVALK